MVSPIKARGTVTTASWISCSSRRRAPMAEPACRVPTPPGCPVPQAFRRSNASAPRTSPMGIRSGRRRRAERTRSDSDAAPSLVRSATRLGRGALEFAGVLDQHHPVAGLGHFGQKRVDQGGLAGGGAAGDKDVLPISDRCAEQLGLMRRYDAGLDIIAKGEDRDGRAANGERGGRDHRGHQALEALSAFRQLCGNPRRAGVHLDADVVGD